MLGSDLKGTPSHGLFTATLAFFVGLTTIVFYGVAGPTLKEAMGLSGASLGMLLSAPHISKALLRVPFGAWVDEVGGKRPFLILLSASVVGLAGVAGTLLLNYPDNFGSQYYYHFILFGVIGGAGGATFSVGVPQTSYWFPKNKQGRALGTYAGVGNVGPGLCNLLLPPLIAGVGLAWAYTSWALFMLIATLVYALIAVDPYYFQLLRRGLSPENARDVASSHGQELFPSGTALQSLMTAARTPRTWVLVFLYTISFGGGFTSLTAWFPTYWFSFHKVSLVMAGGLAAAFTIYGSLIRAPGGSLSDRLGGELVAIWAFLVMAIGGAILTFAMQPLPAVVGMAVLGTGMGLANAAVFKLVPTYVPHAIGGASGLIGGIGGLGTLVILPVLGAFTDKLGHVGYARGFVVIVVLSLICAGVSFVLSRSTPAAAE